MSIATLSPRQALHSSDSNEWYTPATIVDAAKRMLGHIDLDPASCAEANQVIRASRFFTAQQDGLSRVWSGRVFLNPPYGKTGNRSNQEIWSRKLVDDYEEGFVVRAVLLVNAATDTAWFQALARRYPICFIAGRVRFWRPDTPANSPTHGNALVYFGTELGLFSAVCNDLGFPGGAWTGRTS